MKVRHGIGTFVADGPPEFGKASLGIIGALHGFQSWQMFEARIILESNLASLAAERGREEHYVLMAEEVAEMFGALTNPTDYLIHDVLFHRIIAQASGNPILAAIMETVTSSMYDKRRKTVERATDLRESAEMIAKSIEPFALESRMMRGTSWSSICAWRKPRREWNAPRIENQLTQHPKSENRD